MKQVYTVQKNASKKKAASIFLFESGHETVCPNSHVNSNCGDWCPMFEFTDAFTDEGPYMMEHEASVTLHCCGRVIPVEVVE